MKLINPTLSWWVHLILPSRFLLPNGGKVMLEDLIYKNSTSSRARWSARFETWAQALSDSEDQKCNNAESVISSALNNHKSLAGLSIKVFAQGSYRSNTNVRLDSDVDICVRCTNTFHYSLPADVPASSLNFTAATLDYTTYKSKIATALYDRFGVSGVKSGDKAFTIAENTYRIVADVVATFEYRQYYWQNSQLLYKSGVCFFTDSGKFIVNWPEQTYANGVLKNERTGRRYKKVVRVLKGLRNEMEANGVESAKKISSFQISCLAYNIIDGFFNNDDLYTDVKGVAGQIWYKTHDPSRSALWTEVDEIKPLFPIDQTGKQKEVANFFWDLMKYAELES